MRVNFLLPHYPREPVGGFRVVYEYASRLAARGHRVEVTHAYRLLQQAADRPGSVRAAMRHGRKGLRHLLRRDRHLTWHSVHPAVRLRYVPTLEPRHVSPADAYVATAWQTAEQASHYPKDKGEGFYLIQHHETWSGDAWRVDATWRQPLHKIVIARWLLQRAQDMGLDDVVHIPNAIDLSTYRMTRPLHERPPRVAMLYANHEWKGTAVGLAALNAARARMPDLQAVIFGASTPPPLVPPWIEVVQTPPLEDLVEDVYNGSAIYLCPSFAEGWHLPPAEAMACGCALVSTDIGGVRDYADETNALLRPTGDVAALADAVVQLVTNAGLRRSLAEAGQASIAQFDWERSTDLLEHYLRSRTGRS